VLAQDINASGISNVIARAGTAGTSSYGLLTISVKNILAAEEGNRLTVLPGLIGTEGVTRNRTDRSVNHQETRRGSVQMHQNKENHRNVPISAHSS
jgi:hypothetical protein